MFDSNADENCVVTCVVTPRRSPSVMITRLLTKQLRRRQAWLQSLKQEAALANNLQGFTLIELLIVVVIASIIIGALLTLVTQLISTEQRESVRTETQREMQLALNYVAADLRQAVYIYEGTPNPEDATSVPSYINYLPAPLGNGNDYRPVLAFWKTRPIPNLETIGLPAFNPGPAAGGCQAFATVALVNECNNLWLRRQNYSLVAYFQAVDNATTDPNNRWDGRSRIVRYELDKYTNVANLTRTPGYVDPAEIGVAGFVSWPFGPQGATVAGAGNIVNCQAQPCGTAGPAGNAAGAPDTLVDFVDLVTDATPAAQLALRDGEPENCGALQIPGNTVDANGNSVDGTGFINYYMTPPQDPTFPRPAFFVCLRNTRDPATPNNSRVGQIQDTVVFLRGNANGRGGTRTDTFLPTLETRVTMRGVIDRVIR